MWSSQLGKTEILNNFNGFRIDQEPGPMLCVQPTLDMAKTWSKDRLATMLRDTPRPARQGQGSPSRDSQNTMLHKTFLRRPPNHRGREQPRGLASRPIRDVSLDEIDRYPASAGAEGDPTSIVRVAHVDVS
jgi:phage terminase large subunit GpA-like protein